MLLLEVPNFYAHDSYELAHLICFTPHTFQEVLRQAGFEIISLSKSGMPRSALLNLYLTIVASPLPEDDSVVPIRPDRFVRFKRRVGFLYRRMAQKLFPHKAWLPLPDERGS